MADLAAIRLLLQQTGKLLDIRREQLRRTGGGFNIFSVLDIETQELYHNRMLYALLRPDGCHGMGDRFLREFFELVIGEPYPDTPVQVFREYACGAGQIDLLLLGDNLCYPIEIKIHAPDQKLQVKRYADYAASRAENSLVFYLTLDGHEPSDDSTGGDRSLNYTYRDFRCDIRAWLAECGKIAWKVPAVSELIRQYIQLIDRLTNRMEDVYMDMIQDMVGASRAAYESAAAIANALRDAKADLLRRIFSGIEQHTGSRLELLESDYDGKAAEYCRTPNENHSPYLTYKIDTIGKRKLCVDFLLDWRLYFGVYLSGADGSLFDEDATARITRFLPKSPRRTYITSLRKNGVWWEYLPDEEQKLLPDFHSENEAYLNLFDQHRFSAWMRKVYKEIDDCIDNLTKE